MPETETDWSDEAVCKPGMLRTDGHQQELVRGKEGFHPESQQRRVSANTSI